jgi:hypothetical protein
MEIIEGLDFYFLCMDLKADFPQRGKCLEKLKGQKSIFNLQKENLLPTEFG